MTATAALAVLRDQFPTLHQSVHGWPLVYLDNAATTQKPRSVLDAMSAHYERDNANVHRGVHALSQRATDAFDRARGTVRTFINAAEDAEVLFTKGCTEAINLVAASWGGANLREGDVVLLSTMEHHAGIVPWQLAAERAGAGVVPIPISDRGELDLDALASQLAEFPVRMVGVKHVCNALGTVNPIAEVVRMAHAAGALVTVDGAQGLAHEAVDVRAWDVDFYAVSSHKVYGPMGVGALYGKRAHLESMPPYQSGGDMIRTVSFEGTTFGDLPNRFEPGTPNVPGVVGFGRALEFVREVGLDRIAAHERALATEAEAALAEIGGVRTVGHAPGKAGIVSFVTDAAHPHDVGTVLDRHGVAVRTGHHCCMPLMRRLGVPATTRASFALYNTPEDVDALVRGVRRIQEMFA